jgi:acyl carrier protein
MDGNGQNTWTKDKIFEALREILIASLGVEKDAVRPDTSLVNDLGAESIDFLDIGFKVKQTFGVDLPMRVVQDTIASWRNLGDLKALLEARYGVALQPEEMRGFHAMGLSTVLQQLTQKHGTEVGEGDAAEIAVTLARRLTGQIEAGGMELANTDGPVIANLMLENLTSPKIMEAMLRMLTVQALTNFIAARIVAQPSPPAGE